jgi:hypothetical protein
MARRYLLKVWILRGKKENDGRELFDKVMVATMNRITHKAGDYVVMSDPSSDIFDHLVRTLGGKKLFSV